MIIFSVDESGKSVVKLEGKSGKIASVGCCFPPKFANSGTLFESESVPVLTRLFWVVTTVCLYFVGELPGDFRQPVTLS